jgi:hypothetical protein
LYTVVYWLREIGERKRKRYGTQVHMHEMAGSSLCHTKVDKKYVQKVVLVV